MVIKCIGCTDKQFTVIAHEGTKQLVNTSSVLKFNTKILTNASFPALVHAQEVVLVSLQAAVSERFAAVRAGHECPPAESQLAQALHARRERAGVAGCKKELQ